MSDKYYLTTAIAYPNGKPHLGHALEIIQADVVARFQKLLGKEVVFQTGTDEHGLKNWQTAKKLNKEVLDFLDENVSVFKELYKKLNIEYDNFIRTSDEKVHYPGAQKLWEKMFEKGDIYKKTYTGLYCVGCETFKTEKELVEGKCPDHPNRDIEEIEEENYFFKLSKYAPQVIKLIESDEYKITPNSRKNEILEWLKNAEDISFSRKKEALPWGIPVPNDPEHVMYVWCDALSNYITGAGYENNEDKFQTLWPAKLHIIGKDILRFHAAFWPAMLLSAGLELPKELFVHGFVLSNGSKMGKSVGNAIEPFGQIKQFNPDGFRYCLLSAMTIDGDGNYSEEVCAEKINSELVGNLANLCYRAISFTNKNFDSKITGSDEKFLTNLNKKYGEIKKAYEKYDFKKVLEEILTISAEGNKYFQEKEPWKLIKEDKDEAQRVISTCINIIKNLTITISPILPEFTKEIQNQLNISNQTWNDLETLLNNHKINEGKIILKKVELELKEQKEEFPLNLKVAEILEAKPHPDAEKLLVLQTNLGDEKRQLVAGLKQFYKPEELIGQKVVVVTNLEPAKLRGELSEGMLLAGVKKTEEGEIVKVISAKHSKPGTQVYFEGNDVINQDQVKFDIFKKLKLNIHDGKVYLNNPKDKAWLKTKQEVLSIKLNKGKVY